MGRGAAQYCQDLAQGLGETSMGWQKEQMNEDHGLEATRPRLVDTVPAGSQGWVPGPPESQDSGLCLPRSSPGNRPGEESSRNAASF